MNFEKLTEIIAKELNVAKSKVTMDTNLQDDLGADSLDAVELIMAIEEEFSVTIPDESAQSFKTVRDIAQFLENQK